ncbi:hypothetical protein P167DRAFT_539143 [Morchella conica CCBAS932]|uniref:Uncharacterized protein n=1 Tax=Morchella conica CCBAS932 TaxID=1392247 RepID=A0A3N4KGY3_9PEZI|nr:hypothetical protein P167DRAFT_539143 [Morchella conica CCBAS932]
MGVGGGCCFVFLFCLFLCLFERKRRGRVWLGRGREALCFFSAVGGGGVAGVGVAAATAAAVERRGYVMPSAKPERQPGQTNAKGCFLGSLILTRRST